MSCLEGYDDRQLAALGATSAFEVTYRLEDFTLQDGSIIAGYGSTGTGDAFHIIGGVANGVLEWAKVRQPTFVYWYAQGTRAQRLYDRIIRYFNVRGSGWHRLPKDPFTGRLCQPETFWLGHTADGEVA